MARWLRPAGSFLFLFTRIRALAEHSGLAVAPGVEPSRRVIPRWWERLTIAPGGIHHHVAHHRYPAVVWWRLAAVSAAIARCPSDPGHGSPVAEGYCFGPRAAWRDLVQPGQAGQASGPRVAATA